MCWSNGYGAGAKERRETGLLAQGLSPEKRVRGKKKNEGARLQPWKMLGFLFFFCVLL